jgi:hypothetical protein
MNAKFLAALALVFTCGSAVAAEQNFPSVQVSAKAPFALVFSCSAPSAARPADVARILKINDNTQTHELGNKLMVAVSEACNAGVSRIVVQRAATGKSLKWAPAREIDTSVAAN